MRKVRPKYFWEDFPSMFTTFAPPAWNKFRRALAFGHRTQVPVPMDTS